VAKKKRAGIRKYPGPAVQWHAQGEWMVGFLQEHAGIQPCHQVLDIGAGPLRVGWRLIDFLYADNYFAIEPNERVLRAGVDLLKPWTIVQKRPRFSTSATFELDTFDRHFDAIFAHNVFIHCGPAQLQLCLSRVPAVLQPGGTFICSLFLDEVDRMLSHEKAGQGYPHADFGLVYYRQETAERMFDIAGLVVQEVIRWGKGVDTEIESSHQFVAKAKP